MVVIFMSGKRMQEARNTALSSGRRETKVSCSFMNLTEKGSSVPDTEGKILEASDGTKPKECHNDFKNKIDFRNK